MARIMLSRKDIAARYRMALTLFVQRTPWPRLGTTLAIGIGTLTSLAPGLLPRTASAQAVLTGLLAACALAVAGFVRFVFAHQDFDNHPAFRRLRPPLTLATAVLVLAAAIQAGQWQNRLRVDMGTPPIGAAYWTHSAFGAAVILALLLGSARSLAWLLRRLRTAIRRATTPSTAYLRPALPPQP
ncbi:alpha/beta-hydrolase N-terminal domain-containing protein [Nocardia callitridis]|uniref:alpha/beta-hydrolase N-terminal domain-containing protein n=1 Tax=Nocardia callitridis TaxID=648753 RepID=UPI0031E8DE61